MNVSKVIQVYNMKWSEPVPYNLSRAKARATVPLGYEVPKEPGTYVIFRPYEVEIEDRIIDIGKAGFRKGEGLQGRIATSCAHSASQRIATDILSRRLPDNIQIVWIATPTQIEGEELEAGLINLFLKEFGRQPIYNERKARSKNPEIFRPFYEELKRHLVA